MNIIVFYSILVTGVTMAQGASSRQHLSRRDPDADGVIFAQSVLFEQNVVSRGICSVTCAHTQDCVTFTYTPLTSSSGTCRGYSEGMTSISPGSSVVDAKAYFIPELSVWMGLDCATDEDCPALHSECFQGKCLCTPGFYYSHSRNFCMRTCPDQSLLSTFMIYPTGVLIGYDIAVPGSYMTQEECEEACLLNQQCRSIDLYIHTGICYLQTATALDFPAVWAENHPYNCSLRHCV